RSKTLKIGRKTLVRLFDAYLTAILLKLFKQDFLFSISLLVDLYLLFSFRLVDLPLLCCIKSACINGKVSFRILSKFLYLLLLNGVLILNGLQFFLVARHLLTLTGIDHFINFSLQRPLRL